MRFALVLASVATLLLSSAAADSQTTPATPSATTVQPSAANNDPNKMVCRTQAAKTGSRLGATRECRTQREWDDITAQNQHELEKMQASGNMAPQGH